MMTTRIRPLSSIEQTVWRISRGASLNFTTIARVRGDLTVEMLRRGLDAAQARHPYFRVAIDGSNQVQPWFVEGSGAPIPLETSSDEWCEVVQREVHRTIADDGPLARVVWVPFEGGGRVLLTLHHCISDGKSGVFAMRDILAGAQGETLVPLHDIQPVDDRLAKNGRGWAGRRGVLGFVAGEFWKDAVSGKAMPPRYDSTPRCTERTTMVLPREFEPEFVSRLAKRARAEKTSVHGALLAAIAIGVVRDREQDSAVVSVGSPVDMRETLEPPVGEDVGFYISVLPYRRKLTGRESVWDIAREIKAQLIAGKAAKREHILANAMPFVEKVIRGKRRTPTDFVHTWEKVVQSTAGLTNLGRLSIRTDYGSFQAEAVHFMVSPSALGAYVCTATSTNGRMNWNFQYSTPTFTREHAESLTDATVALVREALDSSAD